MPKSSHTIKSEIKKDAINKVRFYISKNRFDDALREIDEYLANNSNCNYLLIHRAYALYRSGKKKEGLEEISNLLNTMYLTNKDSIFAMSIYAEMLYREQDLDNAIYYFKKVIDESETLELLARSKLSKIYISSRNFDEALKVLDVKDFNNKFLNVKRAKVYFEKCEYDNAFKALKEKEYNNLPYELKETISDVRTEQETEFIIGDMYFKQGRFQKALRHLNKAVVIKKNTGTFFQSYLDIVRIYIMQQNIEASINICEEMIKVSTSDIYTMKFSELLAKAYAKKNDYENAEKYYKNADTSEIKTKSNLAKVELAKGNFEKAEEYLSHICVNKENVNSSYTVYYLLILIKFRLKKYDEAQYMINIIKDNIDLNYIDQKNVYFELRRIDLYIRNANKEIIELDDLVYTERQMVSYRDDDALRHITKHHITNANTSAFYENIDVNEVYEYAKEKIKEETAIYDSMFDKYIIKYNNIGFNVKNGDNVNQLTILTLPDTDKIITMYPCDGSESIFTIEEFEPKEKPKVKKLSQIEKFNKKYGTQ